MMNTRVTLAIAAMAALVTAPAAAQVRITRGPGATGNETLLENTPSDFGVAGWRVGQWARYSISENMGGMAVNRFRTFQIVGRSGERYWVETSEEFSGAVVAFAPVRKSLLAFGALREVQGTETYTLNTQDSSIRHTTLLRGGNGAGRRTTFPEDWTRIGEEQITVVGGEFRAVHWRKGGDDLWASAEAGPVGVIKVTSNDMQIELAARGELGARSKIPFPATN